MVLEDTHIKLVFIPSQIPVPPFPVPEATPLTCFLLEIFCAYTSVKHVCLNVNGNLLHVPFCNFLLKIYVNISIWTPFLIFKGLLSVHLEYVLYFTSKLLINFYN